MSESFNNTMRECVQNLEDLGRSIMPGYKIDASRRKAMLGAAVAGVALAAPAMAQKTPCEVFSEDQLQSAGSLWHFCQGDLHLALAALLKVSSAGCS